MPRSLKYSDNKQITNLLENLITPTTDASEYKKTMYGLGAIFGKMLFELSGSYKKLSLACTVEDADFLGKGIIDVLESNGKKVTLTVFWNKRFKPNIENDITVAPIVKEFHDPGYKEGTMLIVTKSIISSSCIVRTNLTRLIEESNPESIFVVAPVLLKGSQANLENEFDDGISKKFQYLYFAEDDEKTKNGTVIPGIGGDIYQRLGFTNQDYKSRFVPTIVKERRAKTLSAVQG